MRVILRHCIVLLALCVFCACAATPAATPTATIPLPTPPPLGDDVLAIYHKSGGIAGIDETLIVGQGGVLELHSRGGNPKSLKVNEPIVQPLRRMLEQKDFGELAPLYGAMGADLFTYTITARDANGNVKTVTTMDAAKHPAYLGQLILMFEQLRGVVAKNG